MPVEAAKPVRGRVPRSFLPLFLLGLLLVGLSAVLVFDLEGEVRFAATPLLTGRLDAPRPSVETHRDVVADEDAGEVPPLRGAPEPNAPPVDPDPARFETVDGLVLPKRGEDGRASYAAFARKRVRAAVPRPSIAVVVTDLGLDSDLTAKAVRLPGEVGLAVSAYADAAPAWQRYARWHGHEALLMLPVAPRPDRAGNAGPLALSAGMPAVALISALHRVLDRGRGYVALAAEAGAFGGSADAFAPIAAELARRGVGFIELDGDALAPVATGVGLAYRSAAGPIDADLTPEQIDRRLAEAERTAVEAGTAVLFARPFELTFERLWRWSGGLPAKDITLVPLSVLLASADG